MVTLLFKSEKDTRNKRLPATNPLSVTAALLERYYGHAYVQTLGQICEGVIEHLTDSLAGSATYLDCLVTVLPLFSSRVKSSWYSIGLKGTSAPFGIMDTHTCRRWDRSVRV